MKLLSWIVRRLERPGAALGLIALALVLSAPSLTSPLVADDLIHQIQLDPESHVKGWDNVDAPYFVFVDGSESQRHALMEEGILSWWTAEGFKLGFWRPVSEATHALDDLLFPGKSPLIHLHGLLWLGLLLLALRRLYARLHTPRVALLALAIFSLDDARGLVVSFASNRNALIASFFAVCVLILHDRWRRDLWRPGALLGPLVLIIALLSGEIAVAVTAFLFSYALFIDEQPQKTRLLSLVPYALVTLGWLMLHSAQGYGSMNSGVYVHPLADPLLFLSKLTERLPVLVFSQAGGLPSDLWLLYPATLKTFIWGLSLCTLVAIVVGLSPLMKRRRTLSFWVMSAALSFIPISATFPSDRLLVMTSIGAAGALAVVMEYALKKPQALWLRRTVSLMVALHLVLAPMALPLRALTMNGLDALHRDVDRAIASTPDVSARVLVIPHALSDSAVCYLPVTRAASHTPRPKAIRLLSTGYQRVDVTRTGPETLLIAPEHGFYSTEGEQMTRSPTLPFVEGEEVRLSDMVVSVMTVNDEGRAMSAEFRFSSPLESPKWLWMHFSEGALKPWAPPGIGERVTLPSVI